MFGLSKYVILALAIASGVGGFAGWRWLEVREARAADKVRYETQIAGLTARITQLETQAQKDREASREYQIQLSAVRSDADALRADVRGLRVIAYDSLEPIPAAACRLDDAAPVDAGRGGTPVDLAALVNLAENCQADAVQLTRLQDWIRNQ